MAVDIDLQDVLTTEYLGQDKAVNRKKPLITVSVITYQHETYISQCLDSLLNQDTSFDYELVIGEDNSTDQTRAICKQYAEKYPDKIRLFLRRPQDKIEVGGRKSWHFNHVANLYSARGTYIVLCDGDDFWTDSQKLQKQVSFMQRHPEYVMTHHHYDKLWNDGTRKPTGVKPKKVAKTVDIINNFQVRTSTMAFKNVFIENLLPPWYFKNQTGDRTLTIFLSLFGDVYYLPDNMAVYRAGVPTSFLAETVSNRHVLSAKMFQYLLDDELFSKHASLLKRKILNSLRKFLLEAPRQHTDYADVQQWYDSTYKNLTNKSGQDRKAHLKFYFKKNFMKPTIKKSPTTTNR